MTLRLYNTLSRSKEDFVPLDPKNVRMYVCGPTVYDFAHIGNARPVIVFDVLFRLLRHLYGENHVSYVRNVTDIDDKINARARERLGGRNIPILDVVRELTDETGRVYREDVAALGCLPPTHAPRATEYVTQMIAMIEKLIAAGHAYAAEGHVLFDVSSQAGYGKLAHRSLDEMIAGARVDVAPYKRGPMDFVLWKPSDAQTPGWESPWGRGRPGWHIECSAMGEAFLGETFDIHGGGIDLVFPHHENEIAQSEGAHDGHALARYWMHNGFLNVEGEKMSKSLGNFVTIHELLDEFPGGALRLAMLQTHYRQPISWSRAKVVEAWEELRHWSAKIYGSQAYESMRLRKVQGLPAQPHISVLEALSDDLNTPAAITALRSLSREESPRAYSALIESCEFLGIFDSDTLGAYGRGISSTNLNYDRTFALHGPMEKLKVALINRQTDLVEEIKAVAAKNGVDVDIWYDGNISLKPLKLDGDEGKSIIQELIERRNAARKARDFKESDRIRDELAAKGIVLKDGPDGTTWDVKR